jgi:DNA invertase Pin-like site-specific DNA recombinase
MPRHPKKPVLDPKRAIGYLRVSTEDQALGPEAQLASLRRWAALHQVELLEVLEDRGISGAASLEARPGLLAAIEAMHRHGAGVLLVAKQDRLARDLVVAAMIERLVERAGGRIMSADGVGAGEGPEAGLMRAMVRAFAEYERALIRARTSAALQAKRARGERAGQIPWGFSLGADGRSLIEDPEEQAAIQDARRLRGEGLAFGRIAAALKELGHCPRGRYWHPQTVARMVS